MLFPNSLWEDACDYRHDCVGRWLYVTDSEINNIFPFGQRKKTYGTDPNKFIILLIRQSFYETIT